jgi:hypothetical protein
MWLQCKDRLKRDCLHGHSKCIGGIEALATPFTELSYIEALHLITVFFATKYTLLATKSKVAGIILDKSLPQY